MKFLLIQPVNGAPRYVSVNEDDLESLAGQFANDTVLVAKDAQTGMVTHFNMGNVAYMTVQDHKDNA